MNTTAEMDKDMGVSELMLRGLLMVFVRGLYLDWEIAVCESLM